MTTQPEPDTRWANVVGGVSSSGLILPMTYERLLATTEGWNTSASVPPGIAALLKTARATFVLAWFHYELLVVAGAWSLMAVEAALRDRLAASENTGLAAVVSEARACGLLSQAQFERIDAGRRLRNALLHPKEQGAWTYGMAAPILAVSHEVICVIYESSASVPEAESGETVRFCGVDFRQIGSIVPRAADDGSTLKFMPQDRYAKRDQKRLNKWGAGPFCEFTVPGSPHAPGVYVLTEDDQPLYVGICESLRQRWGPQGYGAIQPVNCYEGGQSTNCKINSKILAGYSAGRHYDLYFDERHEGRRALERLLIADLRPAWNGTG